MTDQELTELETEIQRLLAQNKKLQQRLIKLEKRHDNCFRWFCRDQREYIENGLVKGGPPIDDWPIHEDGIGSLNDIRAHPARYGDFGTGF